MAETKKTVKADERVKLFIPKGYGNADPNFFISINGVNYLLPRGKESLVPPAVAKEYHRAVRAEERMDRHIEEMQEASK